MLRFMRTELSYAARPAPLAVLAKPALPLLVNAFIFALIEDHARTVSIASPHSCGDFHGNAIQTVSCCKRSAMTGRRLLDVAAIFKASRGVAAKHVALRQHQLDVYSKTSSLARAVKSQTDRVTLTVKAASVLAKRFNGPGPDYSTQASQTSNPPRSASVPGEDGSSGTTEVSRTKDSSFQDHSYDRLPRPDGNEGVKQGHANRFSLPDGSTPPVDTAEVPSRDTESYSEVPQSESMKAPLADGREETDEGLQPTSSGRTSIPNPADSIDPTIAGKAKKSQRQVEKQILSPGPKLSSAPNSEELNIDADQDGEVFYTPSSLHEQVPTALPSLKIPNHTADAQESDEYVPDAQINQDVFYSSSSKGEQKPIPQAPAVAEQEQISDEAYTELFHSPRVAKMLGGQPKPNKPFKGLDSSGAQETRVKQTKSPQEKDQVSSSIRTLGHKSQDGAHNSPNGIADSRPSQARGNENVPELAADMGEDADAMSADPSQVSVVRATSKTLVLID